MRRRTRQHEIAPEEIFLDSANVADFDRAQFEGRLEQPLAPNTFRFLWSTLGAILLILGLAAANLELRLGSAYAAESAHNSLESTTLFAERGVISDRNGVPLATNDASAGEFPARVYKTPGFSELLGYVSYPKKDSSGNYYDTEERGVAGVELAFDAALRGENGTLLVERDAVGTVKSQGSVVPAKDGATLKLAIDADVQKALYHAISSIALDKHFLGGSGVILDVKTGEVLALVSYPEYDSNVLSAGSPSDVIAGYNADNRRPYLNRPLQGLFTPGSVVKPLEAAGALTDKVITADYTINDTGSIKIPNPFDPSKPNIFVDWRALGIVDVRKSIAWSSDVYFYMVGGGYGEIKGLGINRLKYWYDNFGLSSASGIDLPGEVAGFVPTPDWKKKTFDENWNIGDTYHTAIGQYAMQVTPLAMARAVAAIANGGSLPTPTIIAGKITTPTPIAASSESLQVVREGMLLCVNGALASELNVPYVSVAAKTGTAQVGVGNRYDNAWVEGFFPYDNPRYAFAVVMDRGPAGAGSQGVHAMRLTLDQMAETAPEYFK